MNLLILSTTKPTMTDVLNRIASSGKQIGSTEMFCAWLNSHGIGCEQSESKFRPLRTSFRVSGDANSQRRT